MITERIDLSSTRMAKINDDGLEDIWGLEGIWIGAKGIDGKDMDLGLYLYPSEMDRLVTWWNNIRMKRKLEKRLETDDE